jgi:hypothetical protein
MSSSLPPPPPTAAVVTRRTSSLLTSSSSRRSATAATPPTPTNKQQLKNLVISLGQKVSPSSSSSSSPQQQLTKQQQQEQLESVVLSEYPKLLQTQRQRRKYEAKLAWNTNSSDMKGNFLIATPLPWLLKILSPWQRLKFQRCCCLRPRCGLAGSRT